MKRYYLIGIVFGFVLNIVFNVLWDYVNLRLDIALNKYIAMFVFFIISMVFIICGAKINRKQQSSQ